MGWLVGHLVLRGYIVLFWPKSLSLEMPQDLWILKLTVKNKKISKLTNVPTKGWPEQCQ